MENKQLNQGSKERKQNANVKKCPSCSGEMKFNPETQKLSCQYCGSAESFDSEQTIEKNFDDIMKQPGEWHAETVVYQCTNCSAREVISKKDIALECSYCGATNIIKTEELPGMRPDSVLPFLLNIKEATKKAVQWLRRGFFTPNAYKRNARSHAIHGVYYPTFTFDTNTFSSYTGVRVVQQAYTTRVNGQTVTRYVERRYPISGKVDKWFDDILVPASSEIPSDMVMRMKPFKTNEARKYKQEFLYGYIASQYTQNGLMCWGNAKAQVHDYVMGVIRRLYGRVESVSISTSYNDIKYKYVLLPIYVGHSEYREKRYNYYLNGQTGKVSGKRPISGWKVFFTTLGSILLIGGAITLAILYL